MNTQICFDFEGTRYYTFEGNSFIANKFPNTNAIPQADLVTSNSISNSFKKVNGNKMWQATPLVQGPIIAKLGTYFIVKGTIEFEGKTVGVELNENSLTLIVDEDVEVVEESTVESEPEAVEETAVATEEPVEEIVEPEPEPVPEQEPEPVTEPVADNANLQLSKPVVNRAQGFKTPPRANPKVGFYLGNGVENRVSGVTLLGTAPARKAGMVFGERVVTRSVPPVQRLENARLEAERKKAMDAQRQLEEDEAQQRLQESWARPLPPKDKYAALSQPTPVVHEVDEPYVPLMQTTETKATPVVETPDVDVAATTDARAEAKEAVRKKLSPEINKIIGDIPTDMLDNIPEFTMNEVDVSKLEQEGDIYCINKRWCKRGKWFCIDVIPNTARYFYNSRLGVSMEIPINVLKEWLAALNING